MSEEEKKRGYKTPLFDEKILVSTIRRQCSAALYDGWYYETMVWSLDDDDRIHELLLTCDGGVKRHLELVRRAAAGLPLEDSDDS